MHELANAVTAAELVEEYYALVYRYAYRLTGTASDAEDLTQDAFLTAHEKLHQLRDTTRAKAWLCTIVRNAYLKNQRCQLRTTSILSECVCEIVDDRTTECESDEEQLQLALNELSEEFRTTVILFYLQELSYREIAEQMQVPVGTVMSRLARAKGHLRRRLSPDERHEEASKAGVSTVPA